MEFSRRGFLQMIAAAAGAAALDPISKLWVPSQAFTTTLSAAPAGASTIIDITQPLARPTTPLVTWIDELAAEVAQAMSFRLESAKVLSVHKIDFQPSTDPHGRPVLEIPGYRRDVFIPADRALRIIDDRPLDHRIALVNELANELRYAVFPVEVFVPITRELRPGDSFSNDVEVGVGTDPQSGLSVRVIRFEHEGPLRSSWKYGVEMAGGRWARREDLERRHRGYRY